MKKVSKLYIIISVVTIAFNSCKKETDTIGPQITLSKPYENQQFVMYDEIPVVGNVCDDRKLSTIDISITDEMFVTVVSSHTIFPENNCYELNTSIPINDIYIPSGYYYLLVRASDGVNETRKFQKIYITTLPKKLKYMIVVSKDEGDIIISKIDSTFTLTHLKTLTMDYCGSAVSSNAQQFYIAGRYKGDVSVFSTIDWELQWTIPCIENPPFPYFEAIDVHNKMLYVSFREGKFQVYNPNGSIRAQRIIDNAYYPLKFEPFDNYLVTYERSASAMVRQMVVYHVPSYALQQRLQINFEIHDIFNRNEEQCFVFCNHVNYSTVKLYNLPTHSFWDAYTEMSGNIVSVASVYADNFLYACNGVVYWYDYQNTSSFPMYSGQNVNHLVYDETTNHYYFSEDYHTIKQYLFPQSPMQASVFVPDSILNIIPVYNKD